MYPSEADVVRILGLFFKAPLVGDLLRDGLGLGGQIVGAVGPGKQPLNGVSRTTECESRHAQGQKTDLERLAVMGQPLGRNEQEQRCQWEIHHLGGHQQHAENCQRNQLPPGQALVGAIGGIQAE